MRSGSKMTSSSSALSSLSNLIRSTLGCLKFVVRLEEDSTELELLFEVLGKSCFGCGRNEFSNWLLEELAAAGAAAVDC